MICRITFGEPPIAVNGHARRQEILRAVLRISLCSGFLLRLLTSQAEGASPLARCNLLALPVSTYSDSRPDNPLSLPFQDTPEDERLKYRSGPTGDWLVPTEVDPNDASIRGLLLAPDGPLLIDIQVYCDGRAFRSVSEKWIDAALAQESRNGNRGTGVKSGETAEDSTRIEDDTENGTKTKSNESNANPATKDESANEGSVVMAPARFQASEPATWLAQYVRNAKGKVDRNEARWILAQRAGGPPLMELERFSTTRSTSAPLVQFLDTNGDGNLSAAEIQHAQRDIAACDVNQDGNCELTELMKARPRRTSTYYRPWQAEPLFVVVDDRTDWRQLERTFRAVFENDSPNMNGRRNGKAYDAESIKQLALGEPDLVCQTHFGQTNQKSGAELIQVGNKLAEDYGDRDVEKLVRSSTEGIAIGLGSTDVELSAGRLQGSAEVMQVSVGAVIEGLPLWNLVDSDHDGRLSVRERTQVTPTLKALDRNRDGTLSRQEIPTRIRLAVALGPNVHRLLEREALPIPRESPSVPGIAPDWFAGMDANGDGEIAASEFLGPPSQFKALDADGDGFMSIAEASKAPASSLPEEDASEEP